MTRDQIKAIALALGFTERQQADGSMDLNGYVYAFAGAMYAEGRKIERENFYMIGGHSHKCIRCELEYTPNPQAETEDCPACGCDGTEGDATWTKSQNSLKYLPVIGK